jgi:hypothetical protein
LARGQTYLGVYEFLMPFVQIGVTDRVSIGGGTPLLFGFDDGDRPFWITPKVQIVKELLDRRRRRSVSGLQRLGRRRWRGIRREHIGHRQRVIHDRRWHGLRQ